MTLVDFFLLLFLAALALNRVCKLVDALAVEAGPTAAAPRRIPEGWTVSRPAEQTRSANVVDPASDVQDASWVDLAEAQADE